MLSAAFDDKEPESVRRRMMTTLPIASLPPLLLHMPRPSAALAYDGVALGHHQDFLPKLDEVY